MRPFHAFSSALAFASALALAGISNARAAQVIVPDCAGGVEVAKADVMRVEPNGALILTDGRAMLLEGIRVAENGVLKDEALKALRSLAMSAPLTLTSTSPKEDRYDRVRVQAFGLRDAKTVWLQQDMLRRGLARVSILPDRGECAPDFYEAESEARKTGAGLWAFPAYGVKAPARVASSDAGSFQIVEGRLANVARRDGQVFLEFGADRQSSFAATIAPEDVKAFRDLDPPLEALTGRTIRIRGIVQRDGRRNTIELSGPGAIELLP